MLEPVDSPVLSGAGMRARAGAPSSSSCLEGPQPRGGEPDPIVRRGLNRASEGDPEIFENCSWISDVRANEEPHPQVLVESSPMRRNGKLCLDEFDAKKDILQEQATGPLLTFTCVRTEKNSAPNCRMCLRHSGRQSQRSKESLYCPTPGPQIYKMLLVLAARHVSRCEQDVPAHTHQIFCEYQSPIPGGVWEMTKTVYGLEEAPAEHSLYRTIVGKLVFIAADRPDIQFCVKECARGEQSPSARDMQRAERICRYLMGTRDWALKLEPGRMSTRCK